MVGSAYDHSAFRRTAHVPAACNSESRRSDVAACVNVERRAHAQSVTLALAWSSHLQPGVRRQLPNLDADTVLGRPVGGTNTPLIGVLHRVDKPRSRERVAEEGMPFSARPSGCPAIAGRTSLTRSAKIIQLALHWRSETATCLAGSLIRLPLLVAHRGHDYVRRHCRTVLVKDNRASRGFRCASGYFSLPP